MGEKIGTIIEYQKVRKPEYDVFKMVSAYYFCQVIEQNSELDLDPYEQALGFHPVWINLSEAISQNQKILETQKTTVSKWTLGEIFELECLKKEALF